MTLSFSILPDRLHIIVLGALLLVCGPGIGSLAQGRLDAGAIDTIIGSPVDIAEEAIATDEDRVIAAIRNSSDNASEVRKRFSVDNIKILFLPDLEEEGTQIMAEMKEFATGIVALREAIQGSAIFYHAIDSHSVLLNDVIAVEFGDENDVTIIVAGKRR